nr:hypothetical protein [Myxococcota bacterium]
MPADPSAARGRLLPPLARPDALPVSLVLSLLVAGLALAVSLAPAPAAAQNAPSFDTIGDLSGGAVTSTATAVSADASTIVGWSEGSGGVEAVIWTHTGGLVGIGAPSASEPFSRASGVSDDGSVIAGTAATSNGGRAFRWTSGGGFTTLGTFTCFLCTPNATGEGISGDAATVVGSGLEFPFLGSAHVNAARWPGGGTGISDLGDLPGGGDAGIAYGASRDGSLIVGETDSGSGPAGFRWAGSMTMLPGLAGALYTVGALGVAADESVIVGYANASATGSNQPEPTRWVGPSFATAENLGALPGQTSARGRAYAATGDGSVIVGTTRNPAGQDTAFIWDATNGMRSLATELETEYGLDLGGYHLVEARGVSDINGQGELTIVGLAESPAGDDEGFVAVLSPTHCNDGLDNDSDTDVDFPADAGCTALGDRSEGPDCSDGLDNDGDGLFDFPADPDCRDANDLSELPDCSNGIDDDGDGFADFPADPGCRDASGQNEAPQCNDGVDNDNDTDVDFPDDDECLDPSDTSERKDCGDGIDNDGDGLIDFGADPDCLGFGDQAEEPACEDFIDNDGDGRVDYPDAYPACSSPSDVSEIAQCSDAGDNDADTDVDFPSDAQCTGPLYAREAPTAPAAGDLLVVDETSQRLYALDATTGAEERISEGALLGAPQGVIQRSGRILVSVPAGIHEVGATTGVQGARSGALASLGDLPMAVDSSGDVLVLESTGISKLAWTAGGVGTLSTVLGVPVGASELQFFVGNTLVLADDDTAYTTGFGLLGDGVFEADLQAGTVSKVTPGFLGHVWRDLALETPMTLVAVGAHQPLGEGVFRIDVGTGAITAVNTDPAWQQLDGISIATDGSLYVVDSGSCSAGSCSGGLVARVDPVSGARTVVRSGIFSGELQIAVAEPLPAACDDGEDS